MTSISGDSMSNPLVVFIHLFRKSKVNLNPTSRERWEEEGEANRISGVRKTHLNKGAAVEPNAS